MPDSPCLIHCGRQNTKTITAMKLLLINEYDRLIENKRYIQAFKVKMVLNFLLNNY